MTGARIGLISLRLDAIYCVCLGLALAIVAGPTAGLTGLPPALLGTAGVLTMGWGGFVWWAGARRPLRSTLRLVLVANLTASAALVLAGATAGLLPMSIAALALSADVGAFAAAQGVALWRMRSARGAV